MDNNIVNTYIQNPKPQIVPEVYDTFHHEGNPICEDSISVYINIRGNKIQDFNYSGDCSSITSASASFFYDLILGESIESVLDMTYSNTLLSNNFIVSPRRKNATLLPLLAIKNSIHKYKKDNIKENFDTISD